MRTFQVALFVVAAGCGSSNGRSYLDVGSDEGGVVLSLGGGDGQAAVPLDAHVEENRIAVTFVTLTCAGPCADVEAVATGGTAPYSFEWDDGPTAATRRLCPAADTTYAVTVSDTGSASEVTRAPQSVTVSLPARVAVCPEGGVPVDDAGGTPRTLGTVTVPGTADIWLAGQPDGSSLTDVSSGNTQDVAPANSPVEVPVFAGTTLTFAATGATSYTGGFCYGPSPDGGCIIAINDGPANGIGAAKGIPADALVGVFVGAVVPGPSASTPPAIDFTNNVAFASLAPRLDQVFFIGDGLTGTGAGSPQRFTVPAGATRLFLASSDALGGNQNNAGQFSVTVSAQ
ncbi:MAG: hypothetical protein ACRENE_04575 [Polyangiaceae bacterium]